MTEAPTSSSEIIRQMQLLDNRIIVIDQQNSGITAALNVGLAAARGLFIARMDGDDITMPNRFRVQHDFLLKNPNVVLVGGLAGAVDDQGTRSIGADTGSKHHTVNLLCFPPKVVTAVHALILIRAEAMRSIGGYSDRYLHAEDYDMLMRISQLGGIAHVDHRILEYRNHSESISIKNLHAQERHMLQAEIDNVRIVRAKHRRPTLRLSAATLDAYLAIRILRREFVVLGKLNSPSVFFDIVRKIIRGAPGSELYTTARLFLMTVYHAIKSIRVVAARHCSPSRFVER